MSDTQTPNLDQAGQFPRRADPQLSGHCVEMDAVIADKNGRRKLPGASCEDQIEGETRLAGA
ncbi:MAG TPA: hypothetical protein VF470_04210 [Sphingomicrobium sp.]